MAHVIVQREIGGRTLTLETGKYAKQADAAVFATFAETSVISAVVRGEPRAGIDFFPLQIDYRERQSAAGKYPGGFRKREGAPGQKETLTMRMIDRPLRPLFPDGLMDEVVIQNWVESADGQNDPDVIAATGASAALAISTIPFDGPIATVRIGQVDGQLVVNPTAAQLEYADLELVLSGHRDGVNMIEVGSQEVPERRVLEAIKFGHEQIHTILEMIDELAEKAGQEKHATLHGPDESLIEQARSEAYEKILEAKRTADKLEREAAVDQVKKEFLDQHAPEPSEDEDIGYPKYLARMDHRKKLGKAFGKVEKEVTRKLMLDGNRSDGRGTDDIRGMECEVGVLSRTHGSSVFTRGETQAMVTCTLGTGRDEQIVDGLGEEYSQKFYLHYNFPPFCVGEARRVTGPSRREIGHGALAERSLAGILPSAERFPYTVRLLSEILESNGSSSMATVCGGSLALMDAGVPINRTCAGISIGMVSEGDQTVLLTDILGEEDGFGDMDFKVAGTREGVTGIQLDLKAKGLNYELIEQVFERARDARLRVIEAMEQTIAEPAAEISPHAPQMLKTKIDPEKIGRLIGPGGKTIRAIQEDTGAQIDIEEDGTIHISATGGERAERAMAEIERLCEEVQVGKIYSGTVSSIKDFGAFIEVVPGQDGLCHISELTDGYVEKVTDVLKQGETVRVKVLSQDEQGRLRLSIRAAAEEDNAEQPSPQAAESSR